MCIRDRRGAIENATLPAAGRALAPAPPDRGANDEPHEKSGDTPIPAERHRADRPIQSRARTFREMLRKIRQIHANRRNGTDGE